MTAQSKCLIVSLNHPGLVGESVPQASSEKYFFLRPVKNYTDLHKSGTCWPSLMMLIMKTKTAVMVSRVNRQAMNVKNGAWLFCFFD